MRILILLIIFISSLDLIAQGNQSFTTEQFFLDKDYKTVKEKEGSYFTQTIYYQANKVMIDVNLTANRMPIEYREYIISGADTILNGPNIKWFENTKKHYELKYANGTIIGKLNTYYKDGSPKRQDDYDKEGKLITGKCFNEKGEEIEHTPYLVKPKFNGDLDNYLSNQLKYPKKAKHRRIEGIVNIEVTIAEDGTVANTKTISTPDKLLTEEAERLICAMPLWIAGEKEGITTEMKVKIPVEFKLK